MTKVAGVPFLPDNLRWTEVGTLLVTGQDLDDGAAIAACVGEKRGCPVGFDVVESDAIANTATSIYQTDTSEFGMATTAVPVGETYGSATWTSTVSPSSAA
ncbi:hypothetical protein [Rhodococcoides fascians]|uniref:hypothetical protein n=1 Tax=Rhodococcoides fascians TaxID=1828 RepID=UPI00068C928F|nr:hypothetical protein [Rhodococcus fascians]